jgi:hypothetical protein
LAGSDKGEDAAQGGLHDARPDDGSSIPSFREWSCSTAGEWHIGETQSLQQEDDMAKGKLKGNKEAKKPKTEKPKVSASAYKQAQSKTGVSTNPFVRRVQLG